MANGAQIAERLGNDHAEYTGKGGVGGASNRLRRNLRTILTLGLRFN